MLDLFEMRKAVCSRPYRMECLFTSSCLIHTSAVSVTLSMAMTMSTMALKTRLLAKFLWSAKAFRRMYYNV